MHTIKKTSLTTRSVAKLIAGFAQDKRGEDIFVLDMRKVVNFCDYFVVCTGSSDRRVRAIADGVDEGLAKYGLKVRYRHGLQESKWVLLDTGDIVVHIFVPELREFYGLEHLWQSAPRINWKK